MKPLDLNRSVYELVSEYPELKDIMANLGFSEIKKPAVLHSLGKIMTIPKGAKMKGIAMTDIIIALTSNGFQPVGEPPHATKPGAPNESLSDFEAKSGSESHSNMENSSLEERTELLKSYLKRLGAGEALESVRADFVKNFSDVDASEIMKAEQEIMAEGTPIEEVQKLCDIHSALFHGATKEEKIKNAEKAVMESIAKQKAANAAADPASPEDRAAIQQNKLKRAAELAQIPGHPLNTLTRENEVLTKRIEITKASIAESESFDEILANLEEVREIAIHYAEKGDLIYPHLNVKYDISGPSNIMWTVDDEIRDEMSALVKEENRDNAWLEKVSAVLARAEEMIYKESNILFPICAINFTDEEWYNIYQDSKDYADCMGIKAYVWEDAEKFYKACAGDKIQTEKLDNPVSSPNNDEIFMPGGHMNVEQLTAMLNTIPVEITFVDADNINRFFNEGPKLFKRPSMAIDREVFSCHPPKIEPMVRSIIDDFRNNVRDEVPVWMEKQGKTLLVKYMAVRDRNGKYLGTLELVQEMDFAKEYFSKNK